MCHGKQSLFRPNPVDFKFNSVFADGSDSRLQKVWRPNCSSEGQSAKADHYPFRKAGDWMAYSRLPILKKTAEKKQPTSLQEAIEMSELQIAIMLSGNQGESRVLEMIKNGVALSIKKRNECDDFEPLAASGTLNS